MLVGDTRGKRCKFKMSSSVSACTNDTIAAEGTLFDKGTKPILVVDTPGLSENQQADSEHIVRMIKYLKNTVKYVKLFIFAVNGQEPRFDNASRHLLKTFEASLGTEFWSHCIVAYTRWG